MIAVKYFHVFGGKRVPLVSKQPLSFKGTAVSHGELGKGDIDKFNFTVNPNFVFTLIKLIH